MIITNSNLYDKMKFATQIILPAVGTLYFTLSQIWGLPSGDEVVGTIMAIDAFLGILLGISSAQYNASEERFDGSAQVLEKPEGDSVKFNIDETDLYKKDEILLKVEPPQEVNPG